MDLVWIEPYIKRQESPQTYWNFNNNLKTIGKLFHFINLSYLALLNTGTQLLGNSKKNMIQVNFMMECFPQMSDLPSSSPLLHGNPPIFVMEILGLSSARLFPSSPWWIKDYSPQSKALLFSTYTHVKCKCKCIYRNTEKIYMHISKKMTAQVTWITLSFKVPTSKTLRRIHVCDGGIARIQKNVTNFSCTSKGEETTVLWSKVVCKDFP